MSHYIERWCPSHGEWQMDVNNVGECPTCPDLLTTLRAECAAAQEEVTSWRAAAREVVDKVLRAHQLVAALEVEVAQLRHHLRIATDWWGWWLEQADCDCTGDHTCGLPSRRQEYAASIAALAQTFADGDDDD